MNTHHHLHHSAEPYVRSARGDDRDAPVNREFYEQVLLYPSARNLQPDLLSTRYPWFSGDRVPGIKSGPKQKFVLSDGTRTMDIYAVQGLAHNSNHADDVSADGELSINADLYAPPAAGAPAPAVNASMRTLRQNIQRLKLDVTQHVPIHGQVGSHADFLGSSAEPEATKKESLSVARVIDSL